MMTITHEDVDLDLLKLTYNRIDRPMFPFDADMPDPEFKVVDL